MCGNLLNHANKNLLNRTRTVLQSRTKLEV